jgi:hypothetical protein
MSVALDEACLRAPGGSRAWESGQAARKHVMGSKRTLEQETEK